MHLKQVNQSHYRFSRYIHKKRWISIWHQLDEVLALEPKIVLEVGPGSGLFKLLATHFGLRVETLDIDPDLKPNYVASADKLPMVNNSYDCVCAFQMLEHLTFEQSLQAVQEMVRVARKNVVLSLPDAKKKWVYSLHIPKVGRKVFHLSKPRFRQREHKFDGEHYWEINKKGYPLYKIINDFTCKGQARLIKTYRVEEHPYHRFFVFEKNIT